MFTPSPLNPLSMRAPDGPRDARAVRDLEAMEERRLPAGPTLVAQVAGRIVAAVSIRDGSAVADPFERTAATVELLRVRARQLRGSTGFVA